MRLKSIPSERINNQKLRNSNKTKIEKLVSLSIILISSPRGILSCPIGRKICFKGLLAMTLILVWRRDLRS